MHAEYYSQIINYRNWTLITISVVDASTFRMAAMCGVYVYVCVLVTWCDMNDGVRERETEMAVNVAKLNK